MTTRFGPRFMLGMLAALVAAIAVFVLSGDVASALVTLVGAIIAALVTLGVDPSPAASAEPDIGTAPAPARLGSVLEAIVEPVLVIAGGRVEEANGAARDVLGNHITGQDEAPAYPSRPAAVSTQLAASTVPRFNRRSSRPLEKLDAT